MLAKSMDFALASGRPRARFEPEVTSEFVAPNWRSALNSYGLFSFRQLWTVPGENVEEPNIARGGWSRVIRCPLGSGAAMYVKRQFHYQTRSWRCPWRGEPTLQREFRNIEHCRRQGVPTASVIYFATATIQGVPAAILATEALTDVQAFDVCLESLPPAGGALRKNVLEVVARALARLHGSGLKHGCLYPKHILVPTNPAEAAGLRFIDLEKARPYFFKEAALRRDFGTLFRRLPMCTASEREAFLQAYKTRRP